MVPSSLAGLVLFVALLTPGFTYAIRRERTTPVPQYSAFRETLRIVSVSVVCLTAVSLLLAILRLLWPAGTPDIGGVVREPMPTIRRDYVSLAWWAFGLLAVATLVAAMLADPRLAERAGKFVDKLATRHRVMRWTVDRFRRVLYRRDDHIRHESAWYKVFRLYAEDNPGPIDVGAQLDDGTYVWGKLYSYNVGTEDAADRELVLSAPLELTTADGKEHKLESQFTVISARHIVRLDVSHLLP